MRAAVLAADSAGVARLPGVCCPRDGQMDGSSNLFQRLRGDSNDERQRKADG